MTGAGDGGITATPARASDPRLKAAEDRRRTLLAEVDALDADVERLAGELGEFSRRYDLAMAGPFAELAESERFVRQLQALEDELGRLARLLAEPASRPPRRRRAAVRGALRTTPGPLPVEDDADEPVEDDEAERPEIGVFDDAGELQRIRRRLARVLHPDLAGDDAERERLSALMARVNEAYARKDRPALELLAERVGAGDLDGNVSVEERIAHTERRAQALEGIAATLRRERDRLLGSAAHQLWAEARRRSKLGENLIDGMRREVEEEAAEARRDGRHRFDRIFGGAANLGRRWRSAMKELVVRGRKGARPFDPVAESALVRRGLLRLERARAGAAARDLARRLEEAADRVPWEAAALLLAFFAEVARRPPDSLSKPEGWRQVWESLRGQWPGAPEFERLLGRLPRQLGLEVGLRATAGQVTAGLQISKTELLPGVHIALAREPVAAVGRRVLSALGPRLRCPRCRRERTALHLLRTRGLDEVHGIVCPSCGSVLRSYWRYGEVDGLEALAPLALELGIVAEQVVRIAGISVAFQMLPSQLASLTSSRLEALFREMYLVPCQFDLGPSLMGVRVGKQWLGRAAHPPRRGAVLDTRSGSGAPSAAELVDALRVRIAKRFRPVSPDGAHRPQEGQG